MSVCRLSYTRFLLSVFYVVLFTRTLTLCCFITGTDDVVRRRRYCDHFVTICVGVYVGYMLARSNENR